MTRERFEQILKEEGIDSAQARAMMWDSRHRYGIVEIDEKMLRLSAKLFVASGDYAEYKASRGIN